jgi:hypothetical protein
MKQKDLLKKSRKREQRDAYRARRLGYEQKERKRKQEEEEKERRISESAIGIFLEDNKKLKKPEKKLGAETFLRLYSYIMKTAFDKRDSIPDNWKAHSFNNWRQHIEFLRGFVYPYPLPEILIRATHTQEYICNGEGNMAKSTYCGLIRIAKKWINEIASGESFYKRNTKFFTKAEAHHFLCSKVPYEDCSSIVKLYFYAKCRARVMNPQLSMVVADVFGVKFLSHFKNRLVEGFLDLLVRTPEYRYDRETLGDLSDFVLEKIRERDAFSFSGRTIHSVIKLSNEWHEFQRKDAERAQLAASWKDLGIGRFRHETEEYVWTVTELRTAQDLVNEGRKMRNCVGGYADKCASGSSSIFSVEQTHKANQLTDKAATLEVRISNRTVIQAKGKCNSILLRKTVSVIKRWAESNRIKVQLLV